VPLVRPSLAHAAEWPLVCGVPLHVDNKQDHRLRGPRGLQLLLLQVLLLLRGGGGGGGAGRGGLEGPSVRVALLAHEGEGSQPRLL
jgi:hypothetical protein